MMKNKTDRPGSSVFRESDYHVQSPSPRTRRSRRLLERKSTLCMCTYFAISFVLILMFSITIGLRVTGSRDEYDYNQILGDTTLVKFNPSYCDGVRLRTDGAPATLYLLTERPPLTGWSNITLEASFDLTEYKEYIPDYGWYDYGGEYEIEHVDDYVAWSFSLNSGSLVTIDSCLDTTTSISDSEADAVNFLLIQSSSTYSNWVNTGATEDHVLDYQLQPCSSSNADGLKHTKVTESDQYFFVFYSSPSSDEHEPKVNLTLNLYRTEYIPPSDTPQEHQCTTSDGSCSVDVPLHSKMKYSLIQTSEKETSKVKYGDEVTLTWQCLSRSWVYVLIFLCPVIFFTSLFISMYCVVVYFLNRKLGSYHRLINGAPRSDTASGPPSEVKIMYGNAEKQTIKYLK